MGEHLERLFNVHDLPQTSRQAAEPRGRAADGRSAVDSVRGPQGARRDRPGEQVRRGQGDDLHDRERPPYGQARGEARGSVRSLTYGADHLKCEVSEACGFGESRAALCRPTTVLSGAGHFARAIGRAGRERWACVAIGEGGVHELAGL